MMHFGNGDKLNNCQSNCKQLTPLNSLILLILKSSIKQIPLHETFLILLISNK